MNQSPESLCTRLRRERERRQVPLASISANTKIRAGLFESLERGDVSRWPSGIYRRSFIRAYAAAIGLDPDATAREFLEQFPDPLEPPPTPDAARAAMPPAAAATVATPAPAPTRFAEKQVRVRVADAGHPFAPGRLLADMRRRAAAAACDAGVVVAIALCVFIACDTFWLPLGVVMLAYYLGGILLLGNTPGVCLWATGPEPPAHYNRPSDEPRAATAIESTHPAWHFRMPAR